MNCSNSFNLPKSGVPVDQAVCDGATSDAFERITAAAGGRVPDQVQDAAGVVQGLDDAFSLEKKCSKPSSSLSKLRVQRAFKRLIKEAFWLRCYVKVGAASSKKKFSYLMRMPYVCASNLGQLLLEKNISITFYRAVPICIKQNFVETIRKILQWRN